MSLKPNEKIDPETGEITTDSIVADALRKMEAHFGTSNPVAMLVAQVAADVIDASEGVRQVLDVAVPALIPGPTLAEQYLADDSQTPTEWFPGTAIPAHDGEYEVIDAVNGEVSRASYDTLFDQWSCPAQYPTWRGVKGGAL